MEALFLFIEVEEQERHTVKNNNIFSPISRKDCTSCCIVWKSFIASTRRRATQVRFKKPIKLAEDLCCNIAQGSRLTDIIKKSDLQKICTNSQGITKLDKSDALKQLIESLWE